MTVAHTKHASGFDELEDHGKEFRSFRSEGSIRGHSERDEKSVASLNYGLNVRMAPSLLITGSVSKVILAILATALIFNRNPNNLGFA